MSFHSSVAHLGKIFHEFDDNALISLQFIKKNQNLRNLFTSPSDPIVLVGCKSGVRTVHSQAHACVDSQQALAISKQCGALMYVETSAKLSNRSTNSAFEVAALACLGQLQNNISLS